MEKYISQDGQRLNQRKPNKCINHIVKVRTSLDVLTCCLKDNENSNA